MGSPSDVPVPYRIIALMQERNRLFEFPLEQMVDKIKATGFRCSRCGTCCTHAVNSHIFLLEHDVNKLREIDPVALEPAPDPELCDQQGILYVSGYALRMKNDTPGSCWFLDGNMCRIYDQRFSACRIYPYMLRRNVDAGGLVKWRHFSGLNHHGQYYYSIPDEECLTLAREIKEYENAFLTHQISFLETVHEYFTIHNLHHDQKMHDHQVKRHLRGEPVQVKVYHTGELEEHRFTNPSPPMDDSFQISVSRP